jgi:RimJ/RimL family protein N-acetyltransferase
MNFKETGVVQHIPLKNNLQLTLQHAQPNDAEPLLAFIEQVASESDNITFGPGEFGLSVEEEGAFLQRILETSNAVYIVAKVADEVAGTLAFNAGKRPRIQHTGEFGIVVLRKYWSSGIGGHMLACLIDWARQSNIIRKINLHVRVDNPTAIRLYEKYGFVREGRISREFYVHGQFVDVYTMGLQIDPC